MRGNALCAVWTPHADAADSWLDWFPGRLPTRRLDSVVVANPPWESLRHAGGGARRARAYPRGAACPAGEGAGRADLPRLYTAQGRGDRNLFKGFVELFPAPAATPAGGWVALLPGAFTIRPRDVGQARDLYFEHMAVDQWTGFENRAGYFPIDGHYKFGILSARRALAGTAAVRLRFMARDARDALDSDRHVELTRDALERLGGPSRMLPRAFGPARGGGAERRGRERHAVLRSAAR